MSVRSLDRRIAGLFVALLLAIGVAAAPAQPGTHGNIAQTHAFRA